MEAILREKMLPEVYFQRGEDTLNDERIGKGSLNTCGSF